MSKERNAPPPPPPAPEEEPPPFQPDPDLIAYLEEAQRPHQPKAPPTPKEK